MKRLKMYDIMLNVTVQGEDEEDALDYVYQAIDSSNLVDQDGIIGVEIVEDSILECFDSVSDDTDEDEEDE